MIFSTHSEYFNEDGVQVPSSTTILKLINKPHLNKWANIMGFKHRKIEDILERSSDIGTTVHALIEKFVMKRDYIYSPTKHHSKDLIMTYLDPFITWFNKNDVEAFDMEIKMVSKRYGGTIDFYGKLNGKHTILDFKTSKAFHPSMFLQLGSYVQMMESKGNKVEQVAILRVNPELTAIKIMTREEIEPYITCFNLLLDLFYRWSELTGEV